MIGVALWLIVPGIDSHYFRMEDFCITSTYQRSGFGSEFLKLISKEVKKLGCDSILLGTQKDFPSHKFYLENEFREIESVLLYRSV